MSTEIAGRPVLRPAGNIALRTDSSDGRPPAFRKASKPPPPPKKTPPNSPPSKPSSPKTPPLLPQSRTSHSSPVFKPSALSPQSKLPPQSARKPSVTNCVSRDRSSVSKSLSSNFSLTGSQLSFSLDLDFAKQTEATAVPVMPDFTALSSSPDVTSETNSDTHPQVSKGQRRKAPSRNSLTKSPSSGDLFQKTPSKVSPKSRTSVSKLGSLSLDEASLGIIVAAKKAAAMELHAQKKLRIAEYGRIKQGKASRVAPDIINLSPVPVELKRCKFITSQSDPLYVAYHDEEWGVPVYDDRLLFELLVLVGAQVELSWPTILRKRNAYRVAFAGFEPAVVARFNEKQIANLEADNNLMLHGGKIRGVVENAQRILEIVEEFGSFESYMWGFVNGKPMMNSYRYARQVPVKTSKSEWISKELVRRGFRFVGPTIMYSFMQATGMSNDHLVECFRQSQCCAKFVNREGSSKEACGEEEEEGGS